MIVQTVTSFYQFRDAFVNMDRKENFSYNGLEALYNFLGDMSEDIGEPCELDVIAICCDFSEDTYEDILSSYDIVDIEEISDMDTDEEHELIIERLNEETIVVYHDNEKVLFQNF